MSNNVENISSGNKALKFIDHRLLDAKYRGSRSSQHNRYTMDIIITILTLFDQYAPNKQLMVIRNTDIKKRPNNTRDEQSYAQFCDEAKTEVGIGTQDAMRKNLFVDLHRMGLIERYNNNKIPTDPFSQQQVKYVSLTDQGLRLIKEDNISNQYFIFSKGIDNLLGGYIDVLLNLLRDPEWKIKYINIHEFMFFISAINTETNFSIDTARCVELIRAYRNLSSTQRHSVVEHLKSNLKPENYTGDKTAKRDFHNWYNKAQQVYNLLSQTVYFDVRGKTLFLSTENECSKRLSRSLNEKIQYFANHKVSKTQGFELHHVIPLSWSENIHQFKLFDKWLNMVYIDAFSHAKITHNRNRNVVMSGKGEYLTLQDYDCNKVELKKDENIYYDFEKQSAMLDYNAKLLNTV